MSKNLKRERYERYLKTAREAVETSDVTVEIAEIATRKTGVAEMIDDNKVGLCYGADDGSDDKIITMDEFMEKFIVTRFIVKDGAEGGISVAFSIDGYGKAIIE